MSEPQYVALLFTNICSACGTLCRSQFNEFLLVRLCGACKHEELMRLHELPEVLHELVHYSTKDMDICSLLPDLRLDPFVGVAVREEADTIWDQYNELAEDDDVSEETFNAWIEERKCRVARRRKFADELGEFLKALEVKREDERKHLLEARQTQIKEKLLALGWKEGDLKFNPNGSGVRQWYELVEMPKQPKPLTDRIWKNLYAKLYPLLIANREDRLERERLRQKKLNDEDEDLSVEDFKKALEEHRSELDTYISEWRDEARTHLVGLLCEEHMEYPELLQPPKNTDPNVFAGLSDDHKLLLRADSLFYANQGCAPEVRRPYPYNMAMSAAYPGYLEYPTDAWGLEENEEPESPDFNVIHRYTAAQKVARDLLVDLGKPNASFIEIDQRQYRCQRCHDTTPMTWTRIVEHYLEQKHIYAKVEKHALALAQEVIIYKNVHGRCEKPMIKPTKPKKVVKVLVRTCDLCAKKPIAQRVVVPKAKLYKHLLEVHGVDKPKSGVHYSLPGGLEPWNQPGIGYDYKDEDKEFEEVEADNEPETEGGKVEIEYVYQEAEESHNEGEGEDHGEDDEGYIIDDSE
ncbi:unnamed protein product [Rhizoctonia solani]|uniref:Uncharacterized protein n=1 Tax=Rhizoctonia solani TaxID=456999 RepID=A0A8H3GAS2_9AGAM|nr:unnamed protein product [Rhizoctonia solani]